MDIQAIPVFYEGTLFRSTTEGRWAYFMDLFELTWEYERGWISLPGYKGYCPDFFIEDWKTYIEIKGTSQAALRGLEKAAYLVQYTKNPVYVIFGNVSPYREPPEDDIWKVFQNDFGDKVEGIFVEKGYKWDQCTRCGRLLLNVITGSSTCNNYCELRPFKTVDWGLDQARDRRFTKGD